MEDIASKGSKATPKSRSSKAPRKDTVRKSQQKRPERGGQKLPGSDDNTGNIDRISSSNSNTNSNGNNNNNNNHAPPPIPTTKSTSNKGGKETQADRKTKRGSAMPGPAPGNQGRQKSVVHNISNPSAKS